MVRSIKDTDYELLGEFFQIDKEMTLKKKDEDVLVEIIDEIVMPLFEEGGLTSEIEINTQVKDLVYKDNLESIKDYLNLRCSDNLREQNLIKSEDLEIQCSDVIGDFFTSALHDDTINDLSFALKGYDKINKGSKEIFRKRRGSLTANEKIDIIVTIIHTQFNKMNFLSKKTDEEQAKIIIFSLESIDDVLQSTPLRACPINNYKAILDICANKLLNLVGLNDNYRMDILNSLVQSYSYRDEGGEADKEVASM